MARENIFTEFDLDPSDPDSIEKMIGIAVGEDSDEDFESEEEFLEHVENDIYGEED